MRLLEMKIADKKSILGQVRTELQRSIRVREGFVLRTCQGTQFGNNMTGGMVDYIMGSAENYPPEPEKRPKAKTYTAEEWEELCEKEDEFAYGEDDATMPEEAGFDPAFKIEDSDSEGSDSEDDGGSWSSMDVEFENADQITEWILEDRFEDAVDGFLYWSLVSAGSRARFLAQEMAESKEANLPKKAAEFAAYCIQNGTELETVEMGLAILSVFPEADEEIKSAVFKLALYGELTAYAGTLFIPLFGEKEGKRRLRFVIRHTSGKGREAAENCLNPKPEKLTPEQLADLKELEELVKLAEEEEKAKEEEKVKEGQKHDEQ